MSKIVVTFESVNSLISRTRYKPTLETRGSLQYDSPIDPNTMSGKEFGDSLQRSNGANTGTMAPSVGHDPSTSQPAISYDMFGNIPNHFQTGNMNDLTMSHMHGIHTSGPGLAANPFPLTDTDFAQFIDLDNIFRSNPSGMTSPYKEPWNVWAPGNDLMSDAVESPFIRMGTSPSASSQQSQLTDTMDWTSADQAYLKSQSCFTLPSSGALYRLMTVYFQNVHPNLPLINEGDFWDLWPTSSDGGFRLGNFSLFVLHSMCFAASSFAPEEYIQDCGLTNGAVARENFHRRAKLIFDFGFEKNPLHLSQGALLLSYHVRNMDRLRKNSQWLTNAVLYARVAYRDRASLQIEDNEKKERTLKRLWWCAILRDRIMPLGLRRPVQIPEFESRCPMLTERDFDDELGRSKVHDISTQTSIFHMVCTLCSLADVLTPALIMMFGAEKPQDRSIESPEELAKALKEIEAILRRLHTWQEDAKERFPSPIGLGDTHNTVTVFANLMFIYSK